MKICILCQDAIDEEKDTYYKISAFIQGKDMGADYAHRKCWRGRLDMNKELIHMVSGLNETVKSLGVQPIKDVYI